MPIRTCLRGLAVNVVWQNGHNTQYMVSLGMSAIRANSVLESGFISSRDPQAKKINSRISEVQYDLRQAERALRGKGLPLSRVEMTQAYKQQQQLREQLREQLVRLQREKLAAQEQQLVDAKKRGELRSGRESRLSGLVTCRYHKDLERTAILTQELSLRSSRIARYRSRNGIVDQATLLHTYLQKYLDAKLRKRNDTISKGADDIANEKACISPATGKLYRNLFEKVRKWRPNLRLDETGFEVLEEFAKFLQLGCQNSSVKMYMGYLKSALNWCHNAGYPVHPTFDNYRADMRVIKSDKQYCTHEDIQGLLRLGTPVLTSHQCFVRDVFVLACSTGMRFSDFTKLQSENIDEDNISIDTQKTNFKATIRLTKLAREAISRALSKLNARQLEKPLKHDCFNKSLQLIFSHLPGWNKEVILNKVYGTRTVKVKVLRHNLVGSHWGRATFINLSLKADVSLPKIMSMTGHQSEKAVMEYINKCDAPKGAYDEAFDYGYNENSSMALEDCFLSQPV